MLATLADAPLQDGRLVYEPKYDGIRALVEVDVAPGRVRAASKARVVAPRVRIWSRLGNEKTMQFPEVVAALAAWSRTRRRSVVLDGEIVALDQAGLATGFQKLQDRIHLSVEKDIARLASERPVAFVAFDLLRTDGEDLRSLPLVERRKKLEAALARDVSHVLRISDFAVGDGTALYERARAQGWEGLIAKDARSIYRSGQRTMEWRKLKLVKRQELVIGGWTEPRRSRARFGALLLGVQEVKGLRYVGHTGTGFTEKELHRLGDLLMAREIATCPFLTRPASNERPHWVRPELVAEVKFAEWTDEGLLRQAVYLGLRDDVRSATVRREEKKSPPPHSTRPPSGDEQQDELTQALQELEQSKAGGGTLELAGGARVEVTSLRKKLWPKLGFTKGDLLRYYIAVAPYLLPVLSDRPLVMRRFPNGVDSAAFYQQRAPTEAPAGVRVEKVAADKEVPSRLVGGSLATLLYMTQIAAISQDPWFSRVRAIDDMDFAAIDLDPMPGATFSRVLDVARWTREELEALGVIGFPKTSGASGVHIYIPMPPGTSYEAGLLFCQIVATLVARKHPKAATVERSVKGRGRDSVYVDYLQNIRGKTLACAYSARASAFAGASTPLTWNEIADGVDTRDFTIRTLPSRLRSVGDLWSPLRLSKGVDLGAALDRAQLKHGKERGGR
jgi:bifunctional non-homologous end joining protein LigD